MYVRTTEYVRPAKKRAWLDELHEEIEAMSREPPSVRRALDIVYR